ncbi:MAG: NUDIX domain-containing protein [Armatimonadota bacterium]
MPLSPHIQHLRAAVGTHLLLLPGVAAVVRSSHGEILLHRRADDGKWSLPAGAIEPGESPAEAVVREVREETGLTVAPELILGVFGGRELRHTYPNGDEVEYTVIVFGCRVVGGELHAGDGEALEFGHFAPEALPPLGLPYPPELFRGGASGPALFQGVGQST